jgi:hypothetical protein
MPPAIVRPQEEKSSESSINTLLGPPSPVIASFPSLTLTAVPAVAGGAKASEANAPTSAEVAKFILPIAERQRLPARRASSNATFG